MARDDGIHIALTFNDAYWAPAYALMRSICLFSTRRREVVFHLFHRPLSDEHRADLLRIETEFGASLVFYDVDANPAAQQIMARANYNRRLSNIVYARLMFEIFLPIEIERVIYLDCDMMVMRPIERLYDMDLGGKTIAAAPDFAGPILATSGNNMVDPKGLFDLGNGYFNAGMLVIDLVRWRERRVVQLLEAAIEDGTLDKLYYDQDFLNLTFHDDWLELDPRWNFFGNKPAMVILNPFLIHYVGNVKPWNLLPKVVFAREYRNVMTNDVYYRYLRYRWKADWRQALYEITHVSRWF